MIEIEIDGRAIEVPEGITVMDAARGIGTYIPHFCYHKKLSIAANCRMCLVSVEKVPKPVPACATLVTKGMKVSTRGEAVLRAQRAVMEFLLINHPLDCPICDQGGECQLQDLAVGYGGSASRYREEKRVVVAKNLGPLVCAQEMNRCIHCTRCVRFGQEIAGVMELGMSGRGERSEILSFLGRSVDSELSGNMIDLCPVGALTSKPFRFGARTWELARRRSVSPHDGLGANLIVQVRQDRVMRVLPLENEEVNECWITDKDRFSYEALRSDSRLMRPMIKQDGDWREVEWRVALDYAAHALKDIVASHGADAIAAVASPHATLEELYLLGKLMRGLGSDNVDFRLRQSDFGLDAKRSGAPWLGMRIAEIGALDRVLVVGSFLRKDHPLICQRLRQAVKRGCQLSVIHPCADDLALAPYARALAAPDEMPGLLAQVLLAVARLKGAAPSPALAAVLAGIEVGAQAQRIAESLVHSGNGALLLGNLAQHHPAASLLHALAQEIARIASLRFGFLGEAANSVGGYIAGAHPAASGANAAEMMAKPRKGYFLLQVEPELDCGNPARAIAALEQAESVIVASTFRSGAALAYADCLLPVAPFTETSGSFVNTEGRVQSFNAVVAAPGQVRPAWKVLRVLGNLIGATGFEYESSVQVRDEVLGSEREFVSSRLGNAIDIPAFPAPVRAQALQRVADVPIHFADPLARRAPALQATKDAAPPAARMPAALAASLGLAAGQTARVRQGAGEALLEVVIDEALAPGCVRVAAAHPSVAALGESFGIITVERA
ncbi:MAG: NADH-quinone oxidoreductase subunit NuoG [Rhodocyclaceae bacterium]